jgi:cell division initiation protein
VKVTPSDIRRKEFKRAVRGYADEEVDLFLDEVADEVERLTMENAELQERARRGEEQFAGHQQLRDALEKTLVSAQLQADQTRATAERESEAIVRNAENQARGIVGESYAEVQRVQQSLVQLKQLEEDFRHKFQSLLEGYRRLLSEAPAMPVAPPVVMPPVIMPESARAASPATDTPFVVPTAFEEVPEFPPMAAAARFEPPAMPAGAVPAVPAAAATAAAVAPARLDSLLTETPAVFASQPAVPEQVAPEPPAVFQPAPTVQTQPLTPPAPLLWTTDPANTAGDRSVTVDQADIFSAADLTADAPTFEHDFESPTVGDESLTLVREEDPLRNFFFAPKEEGAAEDTAEGDKGEKSKPRDFEW